MARDCRPTTSDLIWLASETLIHVSAGHRPQRAVIDAVFGQRSRRDLDFVFHSP
jgi:hypothetical protein